MTHAIWALLAGALALSAACHRAEPPAPVSRIKSVVARIDGITCETCVPPLTASLQQAYGKSTVAVDDDRNTATVKFSADDDFSPDAFRAAVERVRMRVVTLAAQACGIVEEKGGEQWLVAGKNRFAVTGDRIPPAGQPVCVDGTIDARSEPAVFKVSAFVRQDGSSGF